jgi:PAS domain S-box-containing protein
MSARTSPRVLLVDANDDDRALTALILRQHFPDIRIEETADALTFAERVAHGGYDGVVTELEFPWGDATRVAAMVKRLIPGCPIVVFARQLRERALADGIGAGLDGLVIKGSAGFLELPHVLERALSLSAARRASLADETRYRSLLHGLPVGVLRTAADGTVVEATSAAAEALGLTNEEELNGRELAAFLASPADQARLRERLRAGAAVRDLEVRATALGGEGAWLRINAWPVRGPEGSIDHYEATLEDVSRYKRIERELSEQAEALARSNQELQHFASVISHDLQEPLQLVSRYARLLAENDRTEGDPDTTRFVAQIETSAARMQTMIDDMLEYARIESRGRPFTPVSLDDVVNTALSNLQTATESSGARITCVPLPVLACDQAQMIQLFQNLISNALKFRTERPPEVAVSAIEREDDWVFAVKDNGIGIAPDQLERVFGMFQRLHTAREYPGTGIGLAICKRIVERHGGRIWVTSELGQGSTFFFTIPKRPEEGGPEGSASGDRKGHGQRSAANTTH